MIDHLSLGVADLARAGAFYDAVLATLGHARVWTADDAIGYGPPGGDDRLALWARPGAEPLPRPGFHLALTAPDPAAVRAFFAAALQHGGRDDGPPGLRPRYGPGYYAAFVLDPDGHRLEAVHHGVVPGAPEAGEG
ncbi:MAG: VOC family protein [Myxococcales bacterium]|nr:VOC family protein [Myxococcales bacterium]